LNLLVVLLAQSQLLVHVMKYSWSAGIVCFGLRRRICTRYAEFI